MNQRLRFTRALLVPVVVLAILSHHVHPEGSILDRLLASSGLILLLVAMGGRVWAGAYIAGRKDEVLVADGPYRVVRHPLYLFSLLGFIGAGLAFESLALAAMFALVFLMSHLPTMRAEEQKLRRLFGEEYEKYRRRVPLLIPSLRPGRKDEPVTRKRLVDMPRFSSGLRDALAIPLVFVVADLLEWAKLSEIIPVIVYLP